MTILSDRQIAKLAAEGMIDPYLPEHVSMIDGRKILSAGQGSFGYDMRCADEFRIFTNVMTGAIVDPKEFDEHCFMEVHGRGNAIIPPNSFALTRSVERFRMPRNVTAICLGKSSYARCGLVLGITPIEAGWEGFLTIEISNTTPLPARVYGGEGIAQAIFFEGEQPRVAYDERPGGGRYQGQGPEPTVPRL